MTKVYEGLNNIAMYLDDVGLLIFASNQTEHHETLHRVLTGISFEKNGWYWEAYVVSLIGASLKQWYLIRFRDDVRAYKHLFYFIEASPDHHLCVVWYQYRYEEREGQV